MLVDRVIPLPLFAAGALGSLAFCAYQSVNALAFIEVYAHTNMTLVIGAGLVKAQALGDASGMGQSTVATGVPPANRCQPVDNRKITSVSQSNMC